MSSGPPAVAQAPKFDWDFDVPDTPFWKELPFTVTRNFFKCYQPEETDRMSFDDKLSVPERLEYLLSQLRSTLAASEAAVAPQKLHVVDNDKWRALLLAIATMQKYLAMPREEEKTIRTLLETTQGRVRFSWLNMLGALSLRNGDYAAAESAAREVLPVMQTHEKCGFDSPQALGTTRTLIASLWKQGGDKENEAKQMLDDTFSLINGMGGSKFAKYQDEERDMLLELKGKLENGEDLAVATA